MQENFNLSGNKVIACLVIDDEPPALRILIDFIDSLPYLKLVAACQNAIDALQQIRDHHIDLLFLDIQMPQILGTDFIRSLPSPPKVIFTTAYRKYAVDGFDLNAVDYLLKPISFDRFLRAVNKVMDIHSGSVPASQVINAKSNSAFQEYIMVRAERRNVKLEWKDIIYIESLKDYLKLVLDSKSWVTKMPIQNIEKVLPPDIFIRVHRSFIVNITKVSGFSNGLLAISGLQLPVSRTYRLSLVKALENLNTGYTNTKDELGRNF